MTPSPKVSVIMPCYNCESTLARAINSILDQSYADFELILIDDGSDDNTDRIIQSYTTKDHRIKSIKNGKNRGLAYSLNRGIDLARAEIIMRMDADDWSYPDRLGSQYDFLIKHPDIDVLGGSMKNVNDKGDELSVKSLPEYHDDIIKRIFIKTLVYHPTIMIKKSVFQKYGYFDDALRWAEDADLWYRIYDKVRFHNLPQVVLKYTVKKALSWKVVSNNLVVKYRNLKRQGKLAWGLPILVRDSMIFSLKWIKNF